MEGPAAPPRPRSSRSRSCLGCGYRNVSYAVACGLCGTGLRRSVAADLPRLEGDARDEQGPNPYAILGFGALLAPALGLVPLLQYVGWFLASLVHEIGHCIVAWTFGAPAFPAIRIDGHAAAMHGEQRTFLVLIVWLLILWGAWSLRDRPRLRILLCVALVLHPLLAFTGAHEVLHLLAGHLAELAFAGLAFHRAFSGGFTESTAERITYAMVAWFLLGKNVVMNAGILTSEKARQAYLGNGSFGLEQDFLRAARELGWNLSTVGGLMLLISLAVLPACFLIWHRLRARERNAWRLSPGS